ncbi:hypothetical protein NP233_g3352 [Leucocoprinus birnbaumii]|uniref:C2H2-type domain-containing protein n=1 Tax=Leucocoprinus birnbaumii TaxID=56174 RepID=A0AAD5VZB3_9AGAR|nr:hypothetical protein NP233_g3352 [Leucocoprinus birnbaumii]
MLPDESSNITAATGTQDFKHLCPIEGCGQWTKSISGLRRHIKAIHQRLSSEDSEDPDCQRSNIRIRGALSQNNALFCEAEVLPLVSEFPTECLINVPEWLDSMSDTASFKSSGSDSESEAVQSASSTQVPRWLEEDWDSDFFEILSSDSDSVPELGLELHESPALHTSIAPVLDDIIHSALPKDHDALDGNHCISQRQHESETRYRMNVYSPSASFLNDDITMRSQKSDEPDEPEPAPEESSEQVLIKRAYHPLLTGQICDSEGYFLPSDTPPPPPADNQRGKGDWFPFGNRRQFEFADFIFRKTQMPSEELKQLLSFFGTSPPFASVNELHSKIDAIPYHNVKWRSASITYKGDIPNGPHPSWMDSKYDFWYRDPLELVRSIIANPSFCDEFDYAPYQEYINNDHRFHHFMSGDWAWRQADLIGQDVKNHGSMFVPIILGSDKTTVSVGTGDNSYWPIYLSIGNIHNNARRGHRNGVVLLGFLPEVKAERQDKSKTAYMKFTRQVVHSTLRFILQALKPGMLEPVIVRCGDRHFRKAVFWSRPRWCPKCILLPSYDPKYTPLEPIIPRSTEHSAMIAQSFELDTLWSEYGVVGDIIPFTEYFPRGDIYATLSFDLLHQLIKGVFKDHLMTWIQDYITNHSPFKRQAQEVLGEIDQRISIAPPFTGLRRFPQGRQFKQWTGDDSKALMKVYLPALEGYVPNEMLRALQAFLDFCYTTRKEVINTKSLAELQDALNRFVRYRDTFVQHGVRTAQTAPPRQHSMHHYFEMIRAFGTPNGLCSSITESKHIKAVKEPYRQLNRHKALEQMLKTNSRMDKLAAARLHFKELGMMDATEDGPSAFFLATHAGNDDDDDELPIQDDVELQAGVQLAKRPSATKLSLELFAPHIPRNRLMPLLTEYLRKYHYCDLSINIDPSCYSNLLFTTYPSILASFYAPSDICGAHGMTTERIRVAPEWRTDGGPRYDTLFLKDTPNAETILTGLAVARAQLFWSFKFDGQRHECALVDCYQFINEGPDENTGMWVVKPCLQGRFKVSQIVPLRSIFRAAHLLPHFTGPSRLNREATYNQTLDNMKIFYVNKYIDHHAFEVAHDAIPLVFVPISLLPPYLKTVWNGIRTSHIVSPSVSAPRLPTPRLFLSPAPPSLGSRTTTTHRLSGKAPEQGQPRQPSLPPLAFSNCANHASSGNPPPHPTLPSFHVATASRLTPSPCQFPSPSARGPIQSQTSSASFKGILAPRDHISEGRLLQRETICPPSISTKPEAEEDDPNQHARLGSSSYAVVYLIKEALSRSLPPENDHVSGCTVDQVTTFTVKHSELSTVYNHEEWLQESELELELEPQPILEEIRPQQEHGDDNPISIRTTSTKRRKRGLRKGKAAAAAAAVTPTSTTDETLITLTITSQALAREISKVSRASSNKSASTRASVTLSACARGGFKSTLPSTSAVPLLPTSSASSTMPAPIKKPSIRKITFGKQNRGILTMNPASPTEDAAPPSPLDLGSPQVQPMSTTASNVTSLVMGLNAPPLNPMPIPPPPPILNDD